MHISQHKLALTQARSGLSGKELQDKANISDVTLSRIRNGSQKPRPQTIGRIARALGVDPSEIIDDAS